MASALALARQLLVLLCIHLCSHSDKVTEEKYTLKGDWTDEGGVVESGSTCLEVFLKPDMFVFTLI